VASGPKASVEKLTHKNGYNAKLIEERKKVYEAIKDLPRLPELDYVPTAKYVEMSKEDVLHPLIETASVILVPGAYFGDEGKDGEGGADSVPDFTGKEPVGACPKCQSRVFENGVNYTCEKAVGAGKTCDFRSGAVILQQTVDRTQMGRLLGTGKTEVLKGFVSRKTNRKFEAFLVLKEGKVSFEFPPREKKAGGKVLQTDSDLPTGPVGRGAAGWPLS
jgi:hypothetical protein